MTAHSTSWTTPPDGRLARQADRARLAGPPNTIEHLQPLIDDLVRDHRVVAFDLPGFGFSRAKPGYRFSIDPGAETIIELLEHLGATRIARLPGTMHELPPPTPLSLSLSNGSTGSTTAGCWSR